MGFPHRVYGWYGDEKVAQSTKINGLPLGIRMELPDGREFVHARAGTAVALVAGQLYQAPECAGTATADTSLEQGTLVCASAAVGATTLTITAGGTTSFVKDEYADGYVVTASSAGTGIGLVYKVKANNSAATGATCLFTLYGNDKVNVAIEGGTTKVGVRTNEYSRVIITTADTVQTGPIVGVPPVAVSAGWYCWLQRKGVVAGFTGGTVLIAGEPVTASGAVGGAFAVISAASTNVLIGKDHDPIGRAMATALSAGYATIHLELP